MASRSVFRVNYYLGGQPSAAFVVAYSDQEASSFLGVGDGSASVTEIAKNVEVAGVDKAHAAIPPLPVNVAPPEAPKDVSRAEFDALTKQLADLQAQLNARNTPAQPAPK